jgi:hypothetical protein
MPEGQNTVVQVLHAHFFSEVHKDLRRIQRIDVLGYESGALINSAPGSV